MPGMPQGVLSALVFNVCMVLLPLAGAAALLIIARDHLYAYEYSPAGARSISARVERLNGELIQVDFDRQNQWDGLVAMELSAGDTAAARGFLLSGRTMLPSRSAAVLTRASQQNAGDAPVEMAALQLLTPGTRARYESAVPLLSRRASSDVQLTRGSTVPAVGDERDFELLARSLLAEPESDPVQFILTGFSLGLAGDGGARTSEGAAALLDAMRRDDFPHALADEFEALLTSAAPVARFRNAALANAEGEAAGAYENAAASFRSSLDQDAANRVHAALQAIGDITGATSHSSAVMMLTHASTIADLQRLRLLAQSAGDRAAAAAKRLPRDGRLLEAARGELTMNRNLAIAFAVAGIAAFGLLGVVLFKLFQAARGALSRFQDDDYNGELIDMSTSNWRPL